MCYSLHISLRALRIKKIVSHTIKGYQIVAVYFFETTFLLSSLIAAQRASKSVIREDARKIHPHHRIAEFMRSGTHRPFIFRGNAPRFCFTTLFASRHGPRKNHKHGTPRHYINIGQTGRGHSLCRKSDDYFMHPLASSVPIAKWSPHDRLSHTFDAFCVFYQLFRG